MAESDLKAIAAQAIDDCREELYELSSEIWSNPELGLKEHKACQVGYFFPVL